MNNEIKEEKLTEVTGGIKGHGPLSNATIYTPIAEINKDVSVREFTIPGSHDMTTPGDEEK